MLLFAAHAEFADFPPRPLALLMPPPRRHAAVFISDGGAFERDGDSACE